MVPQLTPRLVPSYFRRVADSPKAESKALFSAQSNREREGSLGDVWWLEIPLGRLCTSSAAKQPQVISAACPELDGMTTDLRGDQSSLLSIPSMG